jgi:hypothetical protein
MNKKGYEDQQAGFSAHHDNRARIMRGTQRQQ